MQTASLFKGNLLLNNNEMDLRETIKEIIHDYPYVKSQKKIIAKEEEDASLEHKRDNVIDLKNTKRIIPTNFSQTRYENKSTKQINS